MSRSLWLDPRQGMSGWAFLAALLGLGLPEKDLLAVVQTIGDALGWPEIHTHLDFLADGEPARRLHVTWLERPAPLPEDEAQAALEAALDRADVGRAYADLARRMVTHWFRSRPAQEPLSTVSLAVIGWAHTPYRHAAPYQPSEEADTAEDAFYIEVAPHLAAGLDSLETFSHLFVISFLDRSQGYETVIIPPWQDRPHRRGVFATRAPNRPSAIGLTRTRLRRIVGNRVYTGPLDLFDGTPVLDLKPFIRSLDGGPEPGPELDRTGEGNDGWLAGSDHLELHRRGVPHTHPGQTGPEQAADLLLAAVGAAWGLQQLTVDLDRVYALSTPAAGVTPIGAALWDALHPAAPPSDRDLPPEATVGVGLDESPGGSYSPAPFDISLRLAII